MKKCSIIIRTKNEERWISSCLRAVFDQSYNNYEVIIVDNNSSDQTLEKVKNFPIAQVVSIDKYLPGASLNKGIEVSTGEYIVCLSGHCIPVNEFWLENLVKTLEDDTSYAGCYGRQEPMAFSTPADKRDLLLVFGLDKKIQNKDSFFHNANSIIKKELWLKSKFDPEITNIEDRIWGQEMINLGYKLVYEPSASVYHYHGIHQDGNIERLNNVVKIIENMASVKVNPGTLDPERLNIIAIIPIKGTDEMIGNVSQMSFTLKAAQESNFINSVYVITDNEYTSSRAIQLGAKVPYIRSKSFSHDYVGIESVLRDAIERIEKLGDYPDLVVILEETFPFREKGLIDEVIESTTLGGHDTVIASRRESGSLWQEVGSSKYKRLDSGEMPRKFKEKSYIGLKGLCCVTHPECIRNESIISNKVGLFKINNPLSQVEVRSKDSRELADKILQSVKTFDWLK